MTEVIRMAKNIIYTKPELEMVEMEAEGSLLLTASNTTSEGNIGAKGLGSSSGSTQITNGSSYNASRR